MYCYSSSAKPMSVLCVGYQGSRGLSPTEWWGRTGTAKGSDSRF